MSKKQNLASFCRLCLVKTTNKVPVFGSEQENVTNLLALIELDINPELEPNATVCFDCIVTLEGFFQFKEQCQTNDEFLKTLPPEESYEGSVASDEEEEEKGDEEDEATMEYDYLQENDDDDDTRDSEEQGLVEDVEEYEPPRKTTKNMAKNPKKTAKTKESEPVEKAKGKKTADDPLTTRQSKRLKKNKSALRTSLKPKKINSVPNKLINGIAIPEFPGPEPTDDDLPKLQESYPDFFHFERNSRSLYFTLVYYGERFNSAVYGPGFTYWQCAHRYKFKCPAWIHVSNDYTEFERRYEHTHGEQKVKGKPELLTPLQALPAVFRIWWHRSKEARDNRLKLYNLKKEVKRSLGDGESREEESLLEELNQSDGLETEYVDYDDDGE